MTSDHSTDLSRADESPPRGDSARLDPYAALRLPAYRRYLIGHISSILGVNMLAAAVPWEIHERTHSSWHLGLVGLVQFLPLLIVALPAGHLLDRFDRRRIIMAAMALLLVNMIALAMLSYYQGPLWSFYGCLLLAGVARAIQAPAKSSFLPQLVPRGHFANAVTWNMSGFQLAAIAGPAIGGAIIGLTKQSWPVFLIGAAGVLLFLGLLCFVPSGPPARERQAATLESLLAGFRFLWERKILLSAMSLDMFAVLLGGATALLPIYASKDILDAGAFGFGVLRAAPALGAIIMAACMAHLPPLRRSGPMLLWSVAGFGLATLVFGLSRSYALSFAMLFVTGMLDNVSVVIRHTLVQMRTPDAMRGRVSAVNSMFISASNELGEFESGALAALFHRQENPAFGPTASVVVGGIGSMLIAGIVAGASASLRRVDRLDAQEETPHEANDKPTPRPA